MVHIGLVAVTNHNYGSILQTYALQEYLSKMGCDPTIFYFSQPINERLLRFIDEDYARTRLKRIYSNCIISLIHKKHKKNLIERNKAFHKFISSKLKLTHLCKSRAELTDLCKGFDFIMVGSDQVWHPMNLRMDYFTLSFVPKGISKGAYAPSFGVSEIPEKIQPAYTDYIKQFTFLSSREKSGVNLIKNLTGREAQLVCDPTLLLDGNEWSSLIYNTNKKEYFSHLVDEPYILCYFIGNNPNQRELVKQFKNQHHCKVVALQHINEYIPSDEIYADYSLYDVDPFDFLNLILHAKYVMTDSFHASVFSLQFHKDFYVFDRFENKNSHSTTSRIDSLLGIVNLLDRKIRHSASLHDLNAVHEIDYNSVDERLINFRKTSIQYLRNIINSI